ncbi:major capsid protein [Microviridae sp.]|nr:major capsid protein [Microviridae sp.]
MSNIFTDINLKKPRSNTFNLSHEKKLSLKMGQLCPICIMEVVPGDIFNISTSQMIRLAPMLAPIMHSINVYTHFFYVPNRILWDNWEDFITGGEDGTKEPAFPIVTLNMNDTPNSSLADYMGLPVGTNDQDVEVSAVPFAAYAKVVYEYYRDQNLQPLDQLTDIDLVDGEQSQAFKDQVAGALFQRAWQHDYFTSALPWTQKGVEATIPLGTEAPLVMDPTRGTTSLRDANPDIPYPTLESINTQPLGAGGLTNPAGATDGVMNFDVTTNTYADLSTATAAGIIDLRRAFKLQEWLEKNARGGTRYTESILSHFGVRSSDARLQRPEFLGGSTSPVAISEVLQTSGNENEPTPQGNMAGHGISVGANRNIRYFAEEHGYIIGLMSVMPKTGYYQGIHKHFSKFDRFDYYWPSFAHIGEQPIMNQELYFSDDSEYNEGTFGYTPRYAEYKFIPSTVHGAFRTSLDYWHLDRKFDDEPNLNGDFIQCIPDTRIFPVELETTEQLYCHVYNKVRATRRMPYFGNPKM